MGIATFTELRYTLIDPQWITTTAVVKRGDSMTNLSSPAAEAAAQSINMSDVIDSLKRLERVGSENSKTTQKLLEAALALENLICQQYQNAGLAGNTRILEGKLEGGDYRIQWYDVCFDEENSPFIWLRSRYGRVSETRVAALALSQDVAGGLIDLIADDLAQREEESRAAIGPLDVAISKITGKNRTAE